MHMGQILCKILQWAQPLFILNFLEQEDLVGYIYFGCWLGITISGALPVIVSHWYVVH